MDNDFRHPPSTHSSHSLEFLAALGYEVDLQSEIRENNIVFRKTTQKIQTAVQKEEFRKALLDLLSPPPVSAAQHRHV